LVKLYFFGALLLSCNSRHKRPTQTQRPSSRMRVSLHGRLRRIAHRPQKVGPEMTIHAGVVTPLDSWENEGGPPMPTTQTEERLDWAGFLARFYPHARKHDYVPLAAYVEYGKTFVTATALSEPNQSAERSRP
jgi:hypothetical protein